MTEEIIGKYDLLPSTLPSEGEVAIIVQPIDLMTHWRRCGLMADFAATFYSYVQIDHINKNLISTIFNELVENATKYSVKKGGDVRIIMKMFNNVLKIQIENNTTRQFFERLKSHLKYLSEAEDLEMIYFETLEQKSLDNPDSGIGLLLMMKDYPVQIGAKFIHDEENDNYRVIMRAYYFTESKEA
jgi:hypothetical protein